MKTKQTKKTKLCPKCENELKKETEKEIDYPLVCLNCDENFYEFEAITDNKKVGLSFH